MWFETFFEASGRRPSPYGHADRDYAGSRPTQFALDLGTRARVSGYRFINLWEFYIFRAYDRAGRSVGRKYQRRPRYCYITLFSYVHVLAIAILMPDIYLTVDRWHAVSSSHQQSLGRASSHAATKLSTFLRSSGPSIHVITTVQSIFNTLVHHRWPST